MTSTKQKQKQNQRPTKRLNNLGFSIFELLVTVAIMGVVIGMVSVTYSIVNKGNTKKAATTINDALTKTREKAMTNAAKEWKMVLSDDKVEIIKVSMDDEVTVYDSQALPTRISVLVNGYDVPTDYDTVSIAFNSSGEVSRAYTDNGTSLMDGSNGLVITCKYKDKKADNIKLYFATGKHSFE